MSHATPIENRRNQWHTTHHAVLLQAERLEQAIAARDLQKLAAIHQWMVTVHRPHNEEEERELFPLLESLGAEDLLERLSNDHQELWELEKVLEGVGEGLDEARQEAAERLVTLVRDHVEAEECLMLPLLKGKSLYFPDEVTEEGYLILEKEPLGPDTWSFVVQAPMVARGRKPGQFFMVAPFPKSERIPLTLAGGDARRGYIRFVMQEVGATTQAMAKLNVGDRLYAVAGPMGAPTELVEEGTVVLVAGGYGSAAILPAAELLKARGQRVITILGGRSRERVLLHEELDRASDELIITTDDGSWGRKGLVTEALKDVMAREAVAEVVAVGPVPMMQAVAEQTRPSGIFTLVSLNALMVDGTGMCGGCRVLVGGESKFACFDGPDFDGHKVDFDNLRLRQSWYKESEQAAREHDCRIGRGPAEEDFEMPTLQPVADFDWKSMDLTALKAPQRMKIQRQEMGCQEPAIRVTNFREVALGFSEDQARLEAARCLQCKSPACVDGCPVGIDIPGFIREIAAGNTPGAARVLKQYSSLPAVCGRVCPQEKQCEARCVTGIKGDSVSIGRLERFAADSLLSGDSELPAKEAVSGKKVAVVGAGPAGLTVAGEMARHGHDVTVFDAFHKPGGVLLYGIPEFRLPNSIVDCEVDALKRMGVKFVMNTLVGRSITLDEMRKDFDAVFLGTGAGLPKMLGIPGEELKGVYTANEFLTRVNLMRADRFPDHGTPVTVGRHVVIVGCGNTAMDASRAARRMGAETVTIVYRRTIAESTARHEELEHTMEEGVEFRWLTNPVRLISDERGWTKEMECSVMELTEPGPDGRRGVRATDERIIIPCDTMVVALGFSVNPLIAMTEPELKTLRGGVVVVNEETGETTVPGVYAGGDVITGGATVILAMGQGKRAAKAMNERLQQG